MPVNIDAPAVGTFRWTEKEIRQLLELFNLAIDTPLSVLAVEMMPRYDQYIAFAKKSDTDVRPLSRDAWPVPDSQNLAAGCCTGGVLRELLNNLIGSKRKTDYRPGRRRPSVFSSTASLTASFAAPRAAAETVD